MCDGYDLMDGCKQEDVMGLKEKSFTIQTGYLQILVLFHQRKFPSQVLLLRKFSEREVLKIPKGQFRKLGYQ